MKVNKGTEQPLLKKGIRNHSTKSAQLITHSSNTLMSNSASENKELENKVDLGTPLLNLLEEAKELEKLNEILHPVKLDVEISDDLCDPVNLMLLRDPVTASDGHTYERELIQALLDDNAESPVTHQPFPSKTLVENALARKFVETFLQQHPKLRDSEEWYLPKSWIQQLETACQQGDIRILDNLYQKDRRLFVHTFKVDIYQGKTALHLAGTSGKLTALQWIVNRLEQRQKGLTLAALLQSDEKGLMSLELAMQHQTDPLVITQLFVWMGHQAERISVKSLASERVEILNSATSFCIKYGREIEKDHFKVPLIQLSRLGAFPLNKNSEGLTLLHVAAMYDQEWLLGWLLQTFKIDIAACDHQGNTALHIAAKNGALKILLSLIELRLKPNLKNAEGLTAEDLAESPKVQTYLKSVREEEFKKERNAWLLKKQENLKEAIEEQLVQTQIQWLNQGQLGFIILEQQKMIEKLGRRLEVLEKRFEKDQLEVSDGESKNSIGIEAIVEEGDDYFESKSTAVKKKASSPGFSTENTFFNREKAWQKAQKKVYELQNELVSACEIGHLESVKLAVQKGAKPDLPDAKGKHPLAVAVWGMNPKVVEYLNGLVKSRMMTWEEIEKHNQEHYGETYVAAQFNPGTLGEWIAWLQKLEQHVFVLSLYARGEEDNNYQVDSIEYELGMPIVKFKSGQKLIASHDPEYKWSRWEMSEKSPLLQIPFMWYIDYHNEEKFAHINEIVNLSQEIKKLKQICHVTNENYLFAFEGLQQEVKMEKIKEIYVVLCARKPTSQFETERVRFIKQITIAEESLWCYQTAGVFDTIQFEKHKKETNLKLNFLKRSCLKQIKEKEQIAITIQSLVKSKGLLVFQSSEEKTEVQPDQVEILLTHVANGNQYQAEIALRRKPALALVSAKVRDLSGREFKNITAFQYAVWALDWHMWKMILNYLPEMEAAKQLKELEEKGTEHGKQVTWEKLITQLAQCERLYDQYSQPIPSQYGSYYSESESESERKSYEQERQKRVSYHQQLVSLMQDSLLGCDLHLMSEFDIRHCEGIKGNTVILTDKNTAYFIFKDKIVMKDDKPQVVEGINRQEIALRESMQPEKYTGSEQKKEKIVNESTLKGGLTPLPSAQKLLPAHVVHEYYRSDRSFSPCPSFEEKNLPRREIQNWFESSKITYWRGNNNYCDSYSHTGSGHFSNHISTAFSLDHSACRKLLNVRSDQVKQLKEILLPKIINNNRTILSSSSASSSSSSFSSASSTSSFSF